MECVCIYVKNPVRNFLYKTNSWYKLTVPGSLYIWVVVKDK